MAARHGLRVDAVLVQAVIAGALSFAHLHDLAAAAGQDGWKAWAYPISVDLLLVAAWRRLRSEGPSRLAWCWFLIALFASLGANVATAGFLDLADPPALLRLGVAGWPALAFLGGTLLAHSADHRTPTPPAPEPTPEPDLADGREPTPEPVPDPEPAPALVEEPPALPDARGPRRPHRPRPQGRRRVPRPHRRPDRHRHPPHPPRRPAPPRRRHRRPTRLNRKAGRPMTSDTADLTAADYLDGARKMTAANRPYLAHLLAEEAARRTTDPATAAGIRASFPDPTTTRKESD